LVELFITPSARDSGMESAVSTLLGQGRQRQIKFLLAWIGVGHRLAPPHESWLPAVNRHRRAAGEAESVGEEGGRERRERKAVGGRGEASGG